MVYKTTTRNVDDITFAETERTRVQCVCVWGGGAFRGKLQLMMFTAKLH